MRDLSRSLHGEKIGEIGFQASLVNELKIIQNTQQLKTQLDITGEVCKQNPQAEIILFRIVQEALHNAVKHSNAANIKVLMNYSATDFTLTVNDDGSGFLTDQLLTSQTGIGLKNMQNRAALIGGKFSLQSSKNNGTSISIQVPNLKP